MEIQNPSISSGTATTQSPSDNSTKVSTTAYVDTAVGTAGDVSGPASSTDNAVARFNGTGGTTIQNSGVIIDDSDSITGVADITCEGINHDYVVYEDQKASGTASGSSSAATWNTRVLNNIEAEKDDSGSFSTLSSNQFTLQAGRYYLYASAPVYYTRANKLRILNATDTTVALVGTSSFVGSSGDVGQSRATIQGEIDIASAKTFQLDHYTGNARATNGLGITSGISGYVEVFAQVYIKRLGP